MKYAVTITAMVTKTYIVESVSVSKADEAAHEQFSVDDDGTPEDYEQQTVSVVEVQ
jgi:hypothetical protein